MPRNTFLSNKIQGDALPQGGAQTSKPFTMTEILGEWNEVIRLADMIPSIFSAIYKVEDIEGSTERMVLAKKLLKEWVEKFS